MTTPQLETALLYYLSAVPQTLAAAFAFAGAFAIYNWEKLKRYRDEAGEQIVNLNENNELKRFAARKDWKSFIDHLAPVFFTSGYQVRGEHSSVRKQVEDALTIRHLAEQIARFVRLGDSQRDMLLRGTVCTSIALVASLSLLPFSAALSGIVWLAWLSMAVLLLLCIGQLCYVGRIMFLVAAKSQDIQWKPSDTDVIVPTEDGNGLMLPPAKPPSLS